MSLKGIPLSTFPVTCTFGAGIMHAPRNVRINREKRRKIIHTREAMPLFKVAKTVLKQDYSAHAIPTIPSRNRY